MQQLMLADKFNLFLFQKKRRKEQPGCKQSNVVKDNYVYKRASQLIDQVPIYMYSSPRPKNRIPGQSHMTY